MCFGLVASENAHVHCRGHGLARCRVIVAQKRGSVGQVEINVLLAIDVVDAAALGIAQIEGVPQARVVPSRSADASRQVALGFGSEIAL